MPKRLDQVNVRISEEGKATLYALQEYYGLSQAGLLEMILREKFKGLGLILEKTGTELYKYRDSKEAGEPRWHAVDLNANRK